MSTEIRCIICDDELLSRQNIRAALAAWPNWKVVDELDSASSLVASIEKCSPAVIFLDIRMPGKTGIDVSSEIVSRSDPPDIIFITAFDQYAIQAFELYALDYLLKPFDEQRFAQSIKRAEKAINAKCDGDRRIESSEPCPRYLKRLFIPSISRIQLVDIEEVYAFVGNGNYVDVVTKEEKLLHRTTITELESNLNPSVFRRCHRSCIVRIDRIRDLRFLGDTKYEIVLDNGRRIKMSRTYRNSVIQALEKGSWT